VNLRDETVFRHVDLVLVGTIGRIGPYAACRVVLVQKLGQPGAVMGGGMRRTWLHGRDNVHKRYLIHVAGHNLGLLMRLLIGAGTPKEAIARGKALILLVFLPDGPILVMVATIGTDHAVLGAILMATRSDC